MILTVIFLAFLAVHIAILFTLMRIERRFIINNDLMAAPGNEHHCRNHQSSHEARS